MGTRATWGLGPYDRAHIDTSLYRSQINQMWIKVCDQSWPEPVTSLIPYAYLINPIT